MACFRRACPLLAVIFFALPLFSCEQKTQPVQFPVSGADQPLVALNREAAEGILYFPGTKKLEYRFAPAPDFSRPVSLELSYSVQAPFESGFEPPGRLVMEFGGNEWVLPLPPADSAAAGSAIVVHYAVPAADPFPDRFGVSFAGDKAGSGKNPAGNETSFSLQIHSVECKDRWFGYYRVNDDSGDHLYVSPFVSKRDDAAWVIDPPAPFGDPAGFFPVFSAILSPGTEAALNTANLRFEVSPHLNRLNIPPVLISPNAMPLVLQGDRPSGFRLVYAGRPPFPAPVTADPGMVLSWPLEKWRDSRFEVFRWEQFPSILIFDFADYEIQSLLLKRLAFFVEKAGFRGRLAGDGELAGLHGWNAHDYRAVDIARFFQAVRESDFPLLAEERELEKILLDTGIIKDSDGRIQAGEGAIISVSRESSQYLRARFMAHEAFHGIFFIDEDFRDFTRRRWQQLPADAKRFILSAFDYYQYDITDEYLVVNEFMAYVMQQTVPEAPSYFGSYLPSRLETIPRRRAALPPKGTSGWPSLETTFTREAEAFSAYANNRWGLSAGTVNMVTVR